MWSRLLQALLFFPDPVLVATPDRLGMAYDEVVFATEDGERLHGWWIPAPRKPARAHVLFLHGNAGNISHRLEHARALREAGFDVFLFDYRGYGRSTGTATVEGTHKDARAARKALLARHGVDPARVVYVGESLGGGVAVGLAGEAPPLALVLQSTFTSIADMARLHYPLIPAAVVPDAYPTRRRLESLQVPVLIIHGDRDDIVPLAHGQALHAAARGRKRLEVIRGAGHNDLLGVAGASWARAIADFVSATP